MWGSFVACANEYKWVVRQGERIQLFISLHLWHLKETCAWKEKCKYEKRPTGWQRYIGCLILVDHFSQKSLIVSGPVGMRCRSRSQIGSGPARDCLARSGRAIITSSVSCVTSQCDFVRARRPSRWWWLPLTWPGNLRPDQSLFDLGGESSLQQNHIARSRVKLSR